MLIAFTDDVYYARGNVFFCYPPVGQLEALYGSLGRTK